MSPTRGLILIASLAAPIAFQALGLQPARAVPEYFGTLLEQYHLVGDPVAQTARCTYCHVNQDGSVPWNPFGDRVHVQLFEPESRGDIRLTLYLVLKQNQDSDGDGYPDALEVAARTLPGDPGSKPTRTIPELEAQLAAMGGLDAFKPR